MGKRGMGHHRFGPHCHARRGESGERGECEMEEKVEPLSEEELQTLRDLRRRWKRSGQARAHFVRKWRERCGFGGFGGPCGGMKPWKMGFGGPCGGMKPWKRAFGAPCGGDPCADQ